MRYLFKTSNEDFKLRLDCHAAPQLRKTKWVAVNEDFPFIGKSKNIKERQLIRFHDREEGEKIDNTMKHLYTQLKKQTSSQITLFCSCEFTRSLSTSILLKINWFCGAWRSRNLKKQWSPPLWLLYCRLTVRTKLAASNALASAQSRCICKIYACKYAKCVIVDGDVTTQKSKYFSQKNRNK